MSRTIRNPVVQETPRNKYLVKRAAAKVVRKSHVSNGSAYRKFFNPWNLCDYKCRNYDGILGRHEERTKRQRLATMVVRGRKLAFEPIEGCSCV